MKFLLLMLLISCNEPKTQNKNEQVPDYFLFSCVYINKGIDRCYNHEVICYRHGQSISCVRQ